jgi:hypothetical protein
VVLDLEAFETYRAVAFSPERFAAAVVQLFFGVISWHVLMVKVRWRKVGTGSAIVQGILVVLFGRHILELL